MFLIGSGAAPATPYTTRRGDWRETETETGRPQPRDWSPHESRRPMLDGDLSASAPSYGPALGWSALCSPLPVRLVGAPMSGVPACRPLRPRRPQPRSPPNEPTRRPLAQVPPTLQMPPPLQDFRCGALICPHSQRSRTISDLSVILFYVFGFGCLYESEPMELDTPPSRCLGGGPHRRQR